MSITHTHMPVCKPTHLVWTVKSENRNDDQQREMLSTLALELARTRAVFPSLSLSVSDSLSSSLSRPLSRRKTPLSRSRAHTQTRTHTHTHTHTWDSLADDSRGVHHMAGASATHLSVVVRGERIHVIRGEWYRSHARTLIHL
jgi:hypothetical protein